ncbi:DUF418 domain-containing protein [Bacillus luteolus]|uniref:DUF418 domain-containing protein n=1 Tax=Litchfieldia luteola TaxID=682179 RepID=A0ABR9QLC6_9BACI|nr:DUF418 domain-containing protein [Cytobacillus luteolus]MBE4909290.1 DUF418 domain-containing protein [Cytobacillus luteolus]MBP1940684.1 uncharacterized protein [Cytobacillus luteolus]
MNQLTPIQEKERIKSIDIIRGLAILGIFLVNMAAFNSPVLYIGPDWWTDKLDLWTKDFINLSAQASFYTMFSFLFGFGVMIFKERVMEKGFSFPKLYFRRLFVLLIIGCIHAFLIWHGDILITYAIIGVIFYLFHKVKPITLLVWSLVLIIVPTILMTGLLLLALLFEPSALTIPYDEKMTEQSVEVYSTGTFTEITSQRFQDWYMVNGPFNFPFMLVTLLPMFLLGALSAKVKWFSKVDENIKSIKIVWFITLMIGLPFKLLPYLFDQNLMTEFIQDTIGGPAIAMFYITSILLLLRKTLWQSILSPLSYVGRLSLTNYLFQSILCTLLFYSYGLGFYGKVSPFVGLILTLVIFSIQIILSKLWLNYYKFGPVEWLWRTLTYGKKQPLKIRE